MIERLRDDHEGWGLSPHEYAAREKARRAARIKARIRENLAAARAIAHTSPPERRVAPLRQVCVSGPRSPLARELGIRTAHVGDISLPFLSCIYEEKPR